MQEGGEISLIKHDKKTVRSTNKSHSIDTNIKVVNKTLRKRTLVNLKRILYSQGRRHIGNQVSLT